MPPAYIKMLLIGVILFKTGKAIWGNQKTTEWIKGDIHKLRAWARDKVKHGALISANPGLQRSLKLKQPRHNYRYAGRALLGKKHLHAYPIAENTFIQGLLNKKRCGISPIETLLQTIKHYDQKLAKTRRIKKPTTDKNTEMKETNSGGSMHDTIL